jgi:hypothetical protein
VHFRVAVGTPDSGTPDIAPTVNFYDSYALLNDLQIDYILVSKARDSEYQRFLADSSHFTMEFQNLSVIVFKVHA